MVIIIFIIFLESACDFLMMSDAFLLKSYEWLMESSIHNFLHTFKVFLKCHPTRLEKHATVFLNLIENYGFQVLSMF
jgi:hypothetical protein